MKLYSFAPQDCSGKVRWLLNEMNLPYDEIRLSFKNGDTKTPEYLKLNPLGQVPVLDDNGFVLTESYAMVQYLADKYPDKGFAPPITNLKERTLFSQWMFFCTDTAEDFFARHDRLPKMNDDYRKQWGDYIQDKTQKIMLMIEKQLTGREYLLGTFSAVDTCMGYALDAVAEETFFNDYQLVKAYYNRLAQRPACVKSEIFKRD